MDEAAFAAIVHAGQLLYVSFLLLSSPQSPLVDRTL